MNKGEVRNMEIGCLARNFNSYRDEVEFAKNNGFKLLQIWYDSKGISLTKDEDPVATIKANEFPAIIHAVLDINEFEEHVPKLLAILKELQHKEVIIHPLCSSEKITYKTIFKLSDKVKYALSIFKENGITLYLENNSRRSPIFNSANEIEIIFKRNPELELVLDLAHISDYQQVNQIIQIKTPKLLHIADKHLEVIHEHLPLGDGNIDFKYIFKNILPNFKGRAILEIVQSSEDIITSRDILLHLV